MHPALSVILFTVLSGFGYGLFIVLALVDLFDQPADPQVFVSGSIAGLILVSGGLLSSTLHLANPKNAWRAFSRFRTSWLSREGVFAILFYLPALPYLYCWYDGSCSEQMRTALSLSILAIALATVFSTGMIYACLKTIRQWHTPLTPINYMTLSIMTGFLLFLSLHRLYTPSETPTLFAVIAIVLIALAGLAKLAYYASVLREGAGEPNPNTATGISRAQVRLLDVGHTAGTFLTDEFGYRVATRRLALLRALSVVLAFGLPLLLLATVMFDPPGNTVLIVATLSAAVGVGIERWLFFADARHVVNLYHGAQRT